MPLGVSGKICGCLFWVNKLQTAPSLSGHHVVQIKISHWCGNFCQVPDKRVIWTSKKNHFGFSESVQRLNESTEIIEG